ncbi:hypothetical protein ACA910_020151 [Epithemia clementina (nom. ined.)]
MYVAAASSGWLGSSDGEAKASNEKVLSKDESQKLVYPLNLDVQYSSNDKNPVSRQFEGALEEDCPIVSISHQLSPSELHPIKGSRHMVTPPDGGPLTLVCCNTTKGSLSLLLHKRWAPIGVDRFLDMVRSQYFSSKAPLFRCTDACQFGLAGDPSLTKQYDTHLQDDVMWLPPGPDHRYNTQGVRRYPAGMLTFAGSGPHSRSNQFVLTLMPNQFMGGGSPWEVPLGELVGESSFVTMSKFYTGYGNHGPSQGLLRREGNSERVQTQWPHLDYITSCSIVDEN